MQAYMTRSVLDINPMRWTNGCDGPTDEAFLDSFKYDAGKDYLLYLENFAANRISFVAWPLGRMNEFAGITTGADGSFCI